MSFRRFLLTTCAARAVIRASKDIPLLRTKPDEPVVTGQGERQ